MKTKQLCQLALLLCLGAATFMSCQKSENDVVPEPLVEYGEVEFVSNKENGATRVLSDADFSNVRKAIITITDGNGVSTEFTNALIDVYQFNSGTYLKKVALLINKVGYSLTRLVLLDENNALLFAIPMEGSEAANLVSDPVPIDFSIKNGESTPVPIEVLPLTAGTAEDFGLAGIQILGAEYSTFLLAVSELGGNKVLSGDYTLMTTDSVFSINSKYKSVEENIIPFNAYDSGTYQLAISSPGYEPYQAVLSLSELQNFEEKPLVVELTPVSTLTDIDGNKYEIVTINDKRWMADNLITTHYNDGAAIDGSSDWIVNDSTKTGAYTSYENNPSYQESYGLMYNWYAVDTGNLCPTDWHVPSEGEYDALIISLGGVDVAGGKLKETGTELWLPPNSGASDEVGFSAKPGGIFQPRYGYFGLGTQGRYWSSSEDDVNNEIAMGLQMDNMNPMGAGTWNDKGWGYSVRCVED
ncbi:MAG: fibrobacter succinogenes major paralogous domain-containing protein [Reichenbachiella sp.]